MKNWSTHGVHIDGASMQMDYSLRVLSKANIDSL